MVLYVVISRERSNTPIHHLICEFSLKSQYSRSIRNHNIRIPLKSQNGFSFQKSSSLFVSNASFAAEGAFKFEIYYIFYYNIIFASKLLSECIVYATLKWWRSKFATICIQYHISNARTWNCSQLIVGGCSDLCGSLPECCYVLDY